MTYLFRFGRFEFHQGDPNFTWVSSANKLTIQIIYNHNNMGSMRNRNEIPSHRFQSK